MTTISLQGQGSGGLWRGGAEDKSFSRVHSAHIPIFFSIEERASADGSVMYVRSDS
jgi:hypothetical protein